MLDDMLKFMFQRGIQLKLIIVLLFAGLEHLMDVVFVCPCDPKLNILASALFFVLPAIIIFLLMLVMQCSPKQTSLLRRRASPRPVQRVGHCEKLKKGVWSAVKATAAPMLWVMMMFFEGQFYVCAKSDWMGRFVKLNDTYEHMWCKPDQSSNSTEKMKLSIRYYVESQWAGLGLLTTLMLCVFVYAIMFCCQRKRNSPETS